MKRTFVIAGMALIMMILAGCAPKVMVPPKVDLINYEVVGLVELESNSRGDFSPYVTQRFLEAISEDQPGVMIVELGKANDLLAELGMNTLGPEALKALGEKFNLNTIFTGNLDFAEPSTKITGFPTVSSMGVQVKVSTVLTVRLRDVHTGATLWTASARDEREIAGVGWNAGFFHFDAEDPDRAYGKMAEKLVRDVSKDYRVTYVRQKR
ncbi:MAG TPA: hypothetical protein ENN07_04235 [candidate division Zixibacteria bacterium]|nr:hypothetical protein [candidate division Zixibacteria bacterium]